MHAGEIAAVLFGERRDVVGDLLLHRLEPK